MHVNVSVSHLAVCAEVGCRDLQRELIVGEFVHLLGQKVSLLAPEHSLEPPAHAAETDSDGRARP